MKKVIAALLLLATLESCSPKTTGPPPVDVDLMVPVLADLQLAESINIEIAAALRDSMKRVYQDKILADYELTRPQFDSLMWIIRSEPEWVATIYSRVNDELATRDAEENRVPEKVKE
ncbi:MAG: DUF4296 domain-containing protein [Bacteroidota bacterium]